MTIAMEVSMKLALRDLEPMLLPGEVVSLAVSANLDDAYGAVGLSDKRVLFRGKGMKEKTLSIGLNKIGQVRAELGGFLTNSYLIIEYSGGEVKLRVHGKDECKAIGQAVTLATL
jgi:Bacterial PH domain